ncbi:MAG: uncharacterized protein H6Q89_3575 [Myxococcaceae bacterium]|nr:uncharacterized protein [Myxococcaceae bacterium]
MRTPVGLLLLVPAVALATSIIPHSLAQRAAEADRIALVQVLSRETIVPNDDPRRMRTISKLAVAQSYKGEGGQFVELVQAGGKSGLYEAHVPGDAKLEVGATALVFLKCQQPNVCALVALGAGALRMVDGQLLVPDLKTATYSKQTLASVIKQLQIPREAK